MRAPPASAQHFIREDVPCAACGYNLRGLPPLGKCPECGESVRLSLRLRWLREPENRLRQQHGMAMQIAGGALVSLWGLPLLFAASLVLGFDIQRWVFHAAGMVIVVTVLASALFATRNIDGVRPSPLTWVIRLGAAATLLLVSTQVAALYGSIGWPSGIMRHGLDYSCGIATATLAAWAGAVLPLLQGTNVHSTQSARGLTYATIVTLCVFSILSMTIGLERAGCAAVLLVVITSTVTASCFWFTGRELWS